MNSKDILKDLISFNTIKDKENKKIMNYIETYLKDFGYETEYKSKCLVMSNRSECNIGFLGHTDTVSYSNDWSYNPFKLTEENGKLYGLGSCDMKGSIAAILSVVSKISDIGIKLFFTYDEEIGFKGIEELVNSKIEFPETMIIGEPTNNEIINASKGLLELKIGFNGIPSHSSTPQEGDNAIERCIEFITSLKEYYKKLKKEEINSKIATMNIGVINGGRSVNIVPDKCEVLIDFRTILSNQNTNIIRTVKTLLKEKKTNLEIINNIKPFMCDKDNIKMSDFITEASFINTSNKLILGVGPNNAHKRNEFIDIESLYKLEEQYIKLIKQSNIKKLTL